MTIDNSQTLARVVHDIEDPVMPEPARIEDPNEILVFCSQLRDAGYDPGPIVEKIEAAADAINAGQAVDIGKYVADDLLTLEPSEIIDRFRKASDEYGTEIARMQVRNTFDRALAQSAFTALRNDSEPIVMLLRKKFNTQVKVIKAAVDKGLDATTDTAALLETAESDVIDAYRKIPAVVVELNQIAAIRQQMARTLGYGPVSPPVASFITNLTPDRDLQGAWNRWVGEIETVQYNAPFTGSALREVHRKRLGGAWLDLVANGYTLHLNTAAEAEAIIAAPKGA